MRSSEDRIAALHERVGEIRKTERARRVRIAQFTSTAVCVAIVVALASLMPGIESRSLETIPGGLHGSIFTDGTSLGYIVIGLLAFLLGTCLTMFLFRLKSWRDERDREDSAS